MTRYAFEVRGQTHHVVVEEHAEGPRFVVAGTAYEPEVEKVGKGAYRVVLDGETHDITLHGGNIELNGAALDIEIRRARPEVVRAGGKRGRADGKVKPPMPGKVVEIHVKQGDEVEEGATLLVLEAMKMQNDLKTPFAGTVKAVHIQEGANVEASTVMLEVEPHPEE